MLVAFVGAYPWNFEQLQLCMVARTTIYVLCFNLEVSQMCVFGWPFYFHVGVFSLVVFYCST